MIIFHEGLPGSGKSYEAMAVRIIPAIKAGREVVAYVEGIDHKKIAEIAGVSEERCRELLHVLTRDQMKSNWVELCRDNALHVFDEAQNFWGNRVKLNEVQTELVTEHRHRGMDIVLMGQDVRDVHATWRRRIELKLCFLKLNAFGKGKKYRVNTFRHTGGDKYSKTGTTITKYDQKYFGTYSSHVSDDTNTDVYTDQRAQVLNHPWLKYGIPLTAIAVTFGAWKAWAFFHPDEKQPVKSERHFEVQRPINNNGAAVQPKKTADNNQQAEQEEKSPIERRMLEVSSKGRIRLAGLITMRNRTSGVIEWIQGGSVVIERLSLDALRTLGVAVVISGDVVQLAVGGYHELATPWPLEEFGRATAAQQSAVRGPQPISSENKTTTISQENTPPRFFDAPGPITHTPTVGSAIKDVAAGR
ncbi:MAG: zonular occludens toxin domain-containing protein [Roseateles sp.]|uniref:zonular occludens toxin family protein n=1 Tax=Roseateles sp. TaxID=1971397 RepID=UPI0039E76277